jgi:hypothetical protein
MNASYDQTRVSVIAIRRSVTQRKNDSFTTENDENLLSGEVFFLSATQ